MAPEPKPPPCTWCHWPVRLVPAPPGTGEQAAPDETSPGAATEEPPTVRRCTNPWCPTRRQGFGVEP